MTQTTEAALAAMREELDAARQEIDQLRLEMLERENALWEAIEQLSASQAAIVTALTDRASIMTAYVTAPQEAGDAAKPDTDTGGMYQ